MASEAVMVEGGMCSRGWEDGRIDCDIASIMRSGLVSLKTFVTLSKPRMEELVSDKREGSRPRQVVRIQVWRRKQYCGC